MLKISLRLLGTDSQFFSFIVIPLSADLAFVYRVASGLSVERFQLLDLALIDKIGHNESSRFDWIVMAPEEKYERAFDAVSNNVRCEFLLASSNFPSFYAVLTQSIEGGETERPNQLQGIQEIQAMLRALTLRFVELTTAQNIGNPPAREPRIGDRAEIAFASREREVTLRAQTLRGAELRRNPPAREPRIGDRVRLHLDDVGPTEGIIIDITPHRLRIRIRGMPDSVLRAPRNVTLL
jgi:hypothetical protein